MSSKGRAIGIDLGTTYSCVAIVENGKARVVQSRLGYSTLPSIVSIDDHGETLVGQTAERRMTLHAKDTIYGSKRLLGRTFLSGVRKQYQPHFRYKLVPDDDGFVGAEIKGKTMRLVDASAAILRELRRSAEESLGETLERAVITVPAYFNENQRSLVRQAGKLAGLDVLRIINEPTAAALSFGCHPERESKLLVFDLGGGTFDVSIIRAKDDVYEVMGVDGNSFLGGIDFDRKLSDWLVARVRDAHPGKRLDAIGRERLRRVAQGAKHELSAAESVPIRIPGFQFEDGTTVDVEEQITRAELEEMTRDLVNTTFDVVERALAAAGLAPSDIDEVLLVGGQTRMPAIHQRLEKLFEKPPSKKLHPDEVVALGAAIAAYSHDHEDSPILRDVLPLSIGIAARGGRFVRVVPRNTPVPCKVTSTVRVPAGARSVTLALYQGERSKVAKNQYLGTLKLRGWEPQARDAKCKLLFRLDAECLLRVRAYSKTLGLDQRVALATKQASLDVMMGMAAEEVDVGTTSADEPSTSKSKQRKAPTPPPIPQGKARSKSGESRAVRPSTQRPASRSGENRAVTSPSEPTESSDAASRGQPPPLPPQAKPGLLGRLAAWFGTGT